MAMSKKKYAQEDAYRKFVKGLLEKATHIIFFDYETTGLSAKDDFPTQLSMRRYKITEDGLVEDGEYNSFFFSPKRLTEELEKLTGITNAMLEDSPTEEMMWAEIANFLTEKKAILTAYNIAFDMKFLKAMALRNAAEVLGQTFESVDTKAEEIPCYFDQYSFEYFDCMRLMKFLYSREEVGGTFKQDHLIKVFSCDEGLNAHRADSDTLGLKRLFEKAILPRMDKEPEVFELKPIAVKSIGFFSPSHYVKRIYINGTKGENCYYDLNRKEWLMKDKSPFRFDEEEIVKQVEAKGVNFFEFRDKYLQI